MGNEDHAHEGTIPKVVESVAAPRLEIVVEREGDTEPRRKVVVDAERVRIGSHPSNEVVVADPAVSRFHCRLERSESAWRLIDNGSLNGTRIAGIVLRDSDLPTPEALLELGTSRVRVREVASVERLAVLERASFGDLYGVSVAMRRLFAILERVSKSEASVLVEGESGTGKELVATEIVRRGPRAKKPFVIVDCGAIAPSLIESELFGHARGAFTGADRERVGAFEAASGGTVFLDEIGELPLDMQPKLLRALEAREVRRLGETQARKIDVRVVAATNRRLEREVNQGRFREDLYFRLSVITVEVPPLRRRLEDVEILVRAFLDQLDAAGSAHLFDEAHLAEVRRHDWPGNVRELRNYVERRVVLQGMDERPSAPALEAPTVIDLERSFRAAKEGVIADFERRYLAALLDWADGNVSKAARKAQMDRMNLHRLLQRHGLRDDDRLRD